MKLSINGKHVEVKAFLTSDVNLPWICQRCCFSDKDGNSQDSCPTVEGLNKKRLCTAYDTRTASAYFVEVPTEPELPEPTLTNANRLIAILNMAVLRLDKHSKERVRDEAVLAYTAHQNDPNITVGDVRLALRDLENAIQYFAKQKR